ncbi:MAG: rhodanese-like domain-containing protein [Deltaproteobacteria bacterium]|nr:rhodanese-like domain-containing protein [Deltaproteobacteria bacterium]
MRRFWLGLTALLLMAAAPAWGDPSKYPEYAKVEPSDKIAIQYVRVEELVQHVLDRKPLTIVDVRQARSYADGHIKGALSIPLGAFYRGAAVPEEGLVVLY